MTNSISVIIPFKNRGVDRLEKLYKSFNSKQIKEFIIVDYNSDKPLVFKHAKCKVIRYNNDGAWNKAHALNIGIKKSTGDFIMTVDLDIVLVDKLDFELKEDSFYYSGNVSRINMKDITNDMKKNLEKSTPWTSRVNYSTAMYGLANGGMQIYSKKFIEKWKGIDENLCYMGGMDNIVTLMAKKDNMKIVQLPVRLLHIEHDKRKYAQFKNSQFALYVQSQRGAYLNEWIVNPRMNTFWGNQDGPDCPILEDLITSYASAGTPLTNDIKILIAVINNKAYLPQEFIKSLMVMFNYTSRFFPHTEIKFIKACQVNHMRNLAVNRAIEENFDYLIQLDDDHSYDQDTIIKLISHQKDFVTVPTKQRILPFLPTQYKKILDPIKKEGNFLYTFPQDGLITCEASGPVAMLMDVKKLKELDYPYYYMDYSNKDTVGGDIVFCKQLKEKGFKIHVDCTIDCPHMVNSMVSSSGIEATVRMSDGSF